MERSLQLKPATSRSRSPGIGCGFPESTSKFRWRPMFVTSPKSRPQSGKLALRNSCLWTSNSTEKACSKPTCEPCCRSVRSRALATMTGASVPEHMVPIFSVLLPSSAAGRRSPSPSLSVGLWSFSSIRATMPVRLRGAVARRWPSSSSLASYSPLFCAARPPPLPPPPAPPQAPLQSRHGCPSGVESRAARRASTSPGGTALTETARSRPASQSGPGASPAAGTRTESSKLSCCVREASAREARARGTARLAASSKSQETFSPEAPRAAARSSTAAVAQEASGTLASLAASRRRKNPLRSGWPGTLSSQEASVSETHWVHGGPGRLAVGLPGAVWRRPRRNSTSAPHRTRRVRRVSAHSSEHSKAYRLKKTFPSAARRTVTWSPDRRIRTVTVQLSSRPQVWMMRCFFFSRTSSKM
mmetsp:Transcript_39818/g.105309  ORF Transcript_39818/g.105309 Transcript_39818/m.105309 type:complete len:417 (-) Transcript_39818:665-1915(-)